MKFPILIAFSTLLIVAACTKKGKISYPKSTHYGENLLRLADSTGLTPGENYNMEVELTRKTNFKVIIVNLSEQPDPAVPRPRWLFTYEKGYVIGNYDYANPLQQFETSKTGKPGTNELKMVFQGTNGKCRFDIYENSAEVTSVRYFTW